MWEKTGIIRSKEKLETALNELEKYNYIENLFDFNKKYLETKNMLKLSKIIINSCIKRKKSIGAHFIL